MGYFRSVPVGAESVEMIGTRFYDALAVGHPADRRTHEELAPMIRRPLTALASLLLTVLGVVLLIPDCASACMCGIEGSQKERAQRAISHSDAVFSGEVVGFEKLEKPPPDTVMMEETMLTLPSPRKVAVTLRVDEAWKGPKQRTVRFTTPFADGMNCAIGFEEGRGYLVYANGGRDGLRVGGCSETKPLSRAGADLALLGNSGEMPKEVDGGVLSDTSGGVSVHALVGLAGLALAASLLVAIRLMRTS